MAIAHTPPYYFLVYTSHAVSDGFEISFYCRSTGPEKPSINTEKIPTGYHGLPGLYQP